jgi:Spy/CpxP family protein refolding chaperone
MKTRFFGASTLLTFITIGALAIGVATAQDNNAGAATGGGGGGRRGGNNNGPGGPGGPGGNFGGRGNFGGGGGINLDDKQRELISEARQKSNDELRDLGEKLRTAQREFVRATIAEKYDEKVVREKADAVAKIQADIAMLNAKAFSSVAPTLKPEQREQIETSAFGYMMVSGGGGRGGFSGGPGGADTTGFRNRGGNTPNDPNTPQGGRRRGGNAPGQ